MSPEQPLPEDAVSPQPHDADAPAKTKEEALSAAGVDEGKPDGAGRGKIIGLAAAGAAIGSAAIAAALLYYNRSGKGGDRKDKATKAKARPKRTVRRGVANPANED